MALCAIIMQISNYLFVGICTKIAGFRRCSSFKRLSIDEPSVFNDMHEYEIFYSNYIPCSRVVISRKSCDRDEHVDVTMYKILHVSVFTYKQEN